MGEQADLSTKKTNIRLELFQKSLVAGQKQKGEEKNYLKEGYGEV